MWVKATWRFPLATAILVMGLIPACVSGTNKLNLVRLNMSKWEVARVMEGEGQATGSQKLGDGTVKEIWEYKFDNAFTGEQSAYKFTFINDKLMEWGAAK